MPGFDLLGAGMMGLGVAGDIFGGLSAYNQAKRQQEQYDYAKQFQNPYWVQSQSQPYIDALNKTLQGQTRQIMRTRVNPFLGSHGIDPNSGAGQSIYAQALAPYIMQNQQTGMNQFLTASGQGQQFGTQNIGQRYGSGNNLQEALKTYYMHRAGQQPAQPQQAANSVNAMTPYSGSSGANWNNYFKPVPMAAGYDPFDLTYNSNGGGGMG